ncbi:MAG: hypothetical protein QXU87_10120 [Candidatus Caldarchaeum sp.]|uniref:Phosphoribosyltransferase domain-containing protein n=1 Tax=Caldiarchaeum subterraneum TaxID=311458 RepID=A0A7C5Q606_CALS0
MKDKLKSLEFGSYLAWVPKKYKSINEEARKAFELMTAVKGHRINSTGVSFIDMIINIMKKELDELPFRYFFQDRPVLVPIPRSAKSREGTLWVPYEICISLEKNKLGHTEKLLERTKSVAQSSQSQAQDRPSPSEHYNSLSCRSLIGTFDKFVLVDDVITRGHTAMGAAWRLSEAFPNAEIVIFAIFRTVSNPSDFNGLYDPRKGTIEYRPENDDCLRRP